VVSSEGEDATCFTSKLCRCSIRDLGLLWLAFAGGRRGLHAVGFALLLRVLQVVALLSEVVAICLTPEAVEQRGRAWATQATQGVKSTGRGCLGRKGSLQACSRVHGIIGVEQAFWGGTLLLCTSMTIPDVLEAGTKPRSTTCIHSSSSSLMRE
jgi:hypothetical protein